MSNVRDAARALGRGDEAEALVLLWNELEPARLAGDRGTLQAIAALAGRIASAGDVAQRREAERLLETVERYASDEALAPASGVARVDGDLTPVESDVEVDGTVSEERVQGGRRPGLGGLLWLLLLAGIVLFNLLGDLLGR
ncbi:MAG: hypothetical protein ICV64_06145 [Thermoleophilia bacterium]|nr:hypothetical protein [Thermoleophilia bacterium]